MVRRITTAPDTQALISLYRELRDLESDDPSMSAGIEWLRDEALLALLPVFGRAMFLRLQQQSASPAGDAAKTTEARGREASDGEAPRHWLESREDFGMEFMIEEECYAQINLMAGQIRVVGQPDPQPLLEESIPRLVEELRASHVAQQTRRHTGGRHVTEIYDDDRPGFDAAIAQVEAEIDGRRPLAGGTHPDLEQHLRNLFQSESEVEAEAVEDQLGALLGEGPSWATRGAMDGDAIDAAIQAVQVRQQGYFLIQAAAHRTLNERREARACGVAIDDYLRLIQQRDVEKSARGFESFLEVALASIAPDARDRLASGQVSGDVHTQVRLKARIDAMLAGIEAPSASLPSGVRPRQTKPSR